MENRFDFTVHDNHVYLVKHHSVYYLKFIISSRPLLKVSIMITLEMKQAATTIHYLRCGIKHAHKEILSNVVLTQLLLAPDVLYNVKILHSILSR